MIKKLLVKYLDTSSLQCFFTNKKQKNRLTALIFLLLSAFSYGQYTDPDDLADAVNVAGSTGGTFIVSNGIYNDFEPTFEVIATETSPIIIKAETVGGVTLTGSSHFVFKKSAYVTLEGFVIDGTGDDTLVKLEGCNNIRITRNVFELETEDSIKWVYIGGVWDDDTQPYQYLSHDNRIDHNTFQNKKTPGNYITIDGTNQSLQSQNDRIDHNHFKNNGPRAVNEQESIRVGWSEMSKSSGYTTIEYNLFEECDGDPEIISVKTCDNTIRHNTFVRSYGTLSLRHGNRNRVEGNYFFGGDRPIGTSPEGSTLYTGGVRIYGTDHVIINNYFEGLTGTKWDAPITLTQGDAIEGESTSLSKHFRAERVLIAYNSLINNSHGIEIGFDNNGKYGKDLADITIANNLITGSENSLVEIRDDNDQGDNISWKNNLMFPSGTATILTGETTTSFDSSEVANENPNLTYNPISVGDETNVNYAATSSSTPIYSNAVTSESINEDIEGQDRPSESNPGADHYSLESIRYAPLTKNDVGPNAYETETGVESLYVSTIPTFSVSGGTETASITSNLTWTVTDDSDWISVSPTSGENNGSIDITTQANTIFETRTGKVTVQGGSLTRIITVSQEAADPTTGLNLINDGTANDPVTVAASTEQDGNEAINTLDKDPDTRWSGEGIGAEIIYNLDGEYSLDLISISTISGKTYLYEIWVSTDGVNYTLVSSVESNTTGEFEHYTILNNATHVKIVGKGQSGGSSSWNSITEIQLWGTIATAIDDDDNDGVENDLDQCPDTTPGAPVNTAGCFALPANNFKIEATAETCPNKNNGIIEISAVENLNYKVTINTVEYPFTNSLTIKNLTPNIYDFCISIDGETYEQCYSIKIEAGTSIAGKATATSNKVDIDISQGTAPFNVLLNGQTIFKTNNSSFSVDVVHGDFIEVKSNIDCEGVFSKQVDLFESFTAYPNPTKGQVELGIPISHKEVVIELYNMQSQLISSQTYLINYGKVQLNIENMPTGIYLAKVVLNKPVNIKIIKQ